MSATPKTGCEALAGSCSVDHAEDRSGAHRAFGFSTVFDERESVELGAELVELDPEENYPRELEVWVDFNGASLELKSAADIEELQERVHTFLQQLAPLSSRLTRLQEDSDPGVHQSDAEGSFGPAYELNAPAGEDGAFKAQLFQSDDSSQLPVAAFWTEGSLAADITADQSRAFAQKIRRMANNVDLLAAQLDDITALHGKSESAKAPPEAA